MLFDGDLLTFSEAARILPAVNGRHVHASAVWRWARKGVGGVKLDGRKLGGRFLTTKVALDDFAKRLAEAEPTRRPGHSPGRPRKTKATDRTAEIEAANQALQEQGL